MQVWIDVYDAAGNRLSDGPVATVKGAQVTRALDGAGQYTATAIGSDPQAIALLTNERRVKIWVEDVGKNVRILAQGIITRVEPGRSPASVDLSIDGPDILDELKRRNSWRGRIYSQETWATVMADLISLVPSWSVDVDPAIASDLIEARFDGVSVLKAFQELTSRYGVHFRVDSSAPNTVVVSEFGDLNGLRIFNTTSVDHELLANDQVLVVERLRTPRDSDDLVNFIEPLGAGEGTVALTLAKSTRTTPYSIQSFTGPDGTEIYYISDAASVAAFGEIQRVIQFKEVAALSNTDTDIENAANALYDAAVEWLIRHKDIKETFSVTVKNVQENIEPGDKITMYYKEQVLVNGEMVDVFDIRDDFWVMMVTETIGDSGMSANLTLSNIDRPAKSISAVIVSSIEAIKLRNLKPLTSSNTRAYNHNEDMAPSFPMVMRVEFTDATFELQRIRLRLETTPFRATASSAASGGASSETSSGTAHKHTWSSLPSATPPGMIFTYQPFSVITHDGTVYFMNILTTVPKPVSGATQMAALNEIPPHTHDVSIPAHTHPLSYGIQDDTLHPRNITVLVNGADKTLELFGTTPLAPAGGAINLLADVAVLTDLIKNASGGLYQEHKIEVRCANDQGRGIGTLEIFEGTQSIKIVN